MDFSKFRESGDLSDITVLTAGTEFRLHRFPLFAKSEYFVKVSRASPTDSNRVELLDFPGGADIFSIVADFCYNMKIDMTKNNIVQIRCAAEYLQMSGAGNLIEISDKFLQDTITSGKLSRSTGAITSLLLYCVTIGPLAEVSGIVEACSDAMVESWLKPPTKFTDPSNFKKQGGTIDKRDDKTMKGLCNLPLEWFVKLLTSARDNGVRPTLLADMATRYISLVLDKDESEKSTQDAGSKPGKENAEKANKSDLVKHTKKVDIGHVLDAVIMELPEEAFSDDVMTIDWITRAFKMATLRGCRCRRPLVKAAGEIMNKLAPDDLCIISPSLLRDIVQESCNDEGEAERACRIIDTYMAEMVRKGVLTGETFRLLASAAPDEARKSHDQLYGILEYVITAERDKMTEDQRQELISRVNFTLVSEEILHQALASDFIPPAHIAKGALALCARLKKDLEVMTTTVSKQDEELRRYNYSYKRGKVTTTPAPRSAYSSAPPFQRGGLSDTDFEPTKDNSDPLKVLDNMLNSTDRQTDEVLTSARNKLATGVGTGIPYNSFRPVQSGEHDISFEEELEFKYDRAFRAMDNSRSKPRSGGYGYRSSFRY
ncbi:uncharacterized protein [Argopecten irradians]|uniref:uncharacterized protein n=1 Tax=Argopecten irradians TaxID=31199 RepID=UPI0037219E81